MQDLAQYSPLGAGVWDSYTFSVQLFQLIWSIARSSAFNWSIMPMTGLQLRCQELCIWERYLGRFSCPAFKQICSHWHTQRNCLGCCPVICCSVCFTAEIRIYWVMYIGESCWRINYIPRATPYKMRLINKVFNSSTIAPLYKKIRDYSIFLECKTFNSTRS